jgi:AcrR family transcriptional regulator
VKDFADLLTKLDLSVIIEQEFKIGGENMAQVLKDEIRENILKAALQEFYEKGYKSAAMREIASKAKIPTGLIYSYYKNKESLFNAVLYPVLYDWERVLTAKDNGHSEEIYGLSKAETECLLNLFEHRRECIILFDKSEGTQYEQEKDRFIEAIEEHLNKHKKDTDMDGIFIHIIANNFVDGLMQVMYHYKGKEWAIMILHKLSEMYLSGIGL